MVLLIKKFILQIFLTDVKGIFCLLYILGSNLSTGAITYSVNPKVHHFNLLFLFIFSFDNFSSS